MIYFQKRVRGEINQELVFLWVFMLKLQHYESGSENSKEN